MPRPKRKCTVEGCEGAHVGRGYCMKHYQQMRYHKKLEPIRHRMQKTDDEVRDLSKYVMLSLCCIKTVSLGEEHEYGNKYCDECGQPCLWKYHPKGKA